MNGTPALPVAMPRSNGIPAHAPQKKIPATRSGRQLWLALPHSFFPNVVPRILAVILFAYCSSASAEEWPVTYETVYATILCSSSDDLNTFTRNIGRGLKLFDENPEKNPMLIKSRVDKIIERVRKLLDMYPQNLRFKIYVYPAYKDLETKYRNMGIFDKAPIAFYHHKTRSIYVSLPDVTDGVLAHEAAHAVINFFFAVPPPARMQEILAQYVDRHLWGEE